MITGRDLNEMREALGMDMTTFARLMCVHAITPSKWKSKAGVKVEIGGFPAVLCSAWLEASPKPMTANAMSRIFSQVDAREGQFRAVGKFMEQLSKCRG